MLLLLFWRWLVRAGRALLDESDMVAPVPLHLGLDRLFLRHYNKSAILALEIKLLIGIQAMVDLLVRARATASQGRFNHPGRLLHNNVQERLLGDTARGRGGHKAIVVVDDVLTNGGGGGATVGLRVYPHPQTLMAGKRPFSRRAGSLLPGWISGRGRGERMRAKIGDH